MVKIQYFLPVHCSNLEGIKRQLYDYGILHKENENMFRMAPEAVDPAILSRGSSFRRYTRSALLLLRDDPLSYQRPPCVSDTNLLSLNIWKLFNPNYKKTHSIEELNNTCGTAGNHTKNSRGLSVGQLMPAFAKRESTNIKDTIELNHPIEQRNEFNRSMNTSVHLQTSLTHVGTRQTTNKDHSIQFHGRRIGSGRVASADYRWELNKFQSERSCDFSNNDNNTGNNEFNRSNGTSSVIVAEPHNREASFLNHKFNNANSSMYSYHYRHRKYGERNEEPEWFTGGPTSQNDVIELRGFDENEETRDEATSKNSSHSDAILAKTVADDVDVVVVNSSSPPPARSTPTKHIARDINNKVDDKNEKLTAFNYDEFLTVDPLNTWLAKGRNSKFSTWFNRQDAFERKNKVSENRRSSPTDFHNNHCRYESQGKSMDTNTNLSATLFPVTNNVNQNNALFEFLQRGKFNNAGVVNLSLPRTNKNKPTLIPNVQELEARMRTVPNVPNWQQPYLLGNNCLPQHTNQHPNGPAQNQNIETFKKLLQQLIPSMPLQNSAMNRRPKPLYFHN